MATSIGFDIFARDRASTVFDKVGKKTDEVGQKTKKWSDTAKLAGAAAGAGIIAFGKSSLAAFKDADASQRKLQDAYARFPKLADVNIGSLRALNSELQNHTKFDDDDLAGAQATLAQYKLTGTQIKQLTPLLADYAQKTGKDLPTAAGDLGKALLGQGRSLKAIGINFKDLKDPTANFNELMGGLRTQVGGFAEKEGKTAEGRAAILNNKFGDFQETVGSKLLPVLAKLAGVGIATINWMNRNGTVVKVLASVIGVLAGAWLAVTIAQKAHGVVTTVWTGVTKSAAVAQWLLNAAMSANPVMLVVIAIAALAAGLVIAYKHSETFRGIVLGTFQAIANAGIFMWNNAIRPVLKMWIDTWLTVVGALVHGAAAAFGWVPGIGGKLKAAARTFDAFKDEVNSKLGRIQPINLQANTGPALSSVNRFLQYVNSQSAQVRINALTGGSRMAGFASGTSNAPAGLAKVGENGMELVNFRGGEQVYNHEDSARMLAKTGGASSVQVNVTVNAGVGANGQQVGNEIVAILERWKGSGGNSLLFA